MNERGGLTVDELIESLRRRQAGMPSEIGTFLIFEACEAMLVSGPVRLGASDLRIDIDGGVSLVAGAPAADDEASARSVHALLTSVLLHARPAPAPGLLRLVEQGPSAGQWSLQALRDDLEASLVPLNRNASRRVLARLLREAAADRVRFGRHGGPKSFEDLDAELDDFLGDASEGRRSRSPARTPSPSASPRDEVPTSVSPPSVRVSAAPAVEAPTALEPSLEVSPAPGQVRQAPTSKPSLPSIDPAAPPRSRAGFWLGLGLVGLAAALVAAVWVLRPDVRARLNGEESPALPAATDPQPASPRLRSGELVLQVTPAGSQVLLRVGEAPVEVEGVAVGQAQEFVAMAEGRAPSRAVILAADTWEQTPEGPFFELAMQTRTMAGGKSRGLGDSLLPVEPGEAHRHDGRVRIVTSPRGATVYRVIGFAPQARIRGLDTTIEHTLLVSREGYSDRTVRIRPQDWPVGDAPVLREAVALRH